jgi:hypothetical protein
MTRCPRVIDSRDDVMTSIDKKPPPERSLAGATKENASSSSAPKTASLASGRVHTVLSWRQKAPAAITSQDEWKLKESLENGALKVPSARFAGLLRPVQSEANETLFTDAKQKSQELAPTDREPIVEVDLKSGALSETSSEARAHGRLLLELTPATVDAIYADAAKHAVPGAFDPPAPRKPSAPTRLEDPYEVEPRALLETTGAEAVALSGHLPQDNVWRAQKNTFDNNWGHAYAGQFAATLFSKSVMKILGEQSMTPLTRELILGLGDAFGAGVMRAKEELDKGVTPDDVPLTVRRTFRFKLDGNSTIEVTPQLTITAGDMKVFDVTKGSQYFSVRVTFP